jgi:hypothetical protein
MAMLTNCKVCGSQTELQGWVDLGKSCEIVRGNYLPLTGVAIAYRRCLECGFLFTRHFDDWSVEDWAATIYNEDYKLADPEAYDGSRARDQCDYVCIVAGQFQARTILDYGGGSGTLAAMLIERALAAASYDPIMGSAFEWSAEPYDLVTCFEVLEHTTTPMTTLDHIRLMSTGRMVFSTLVMDGLPRQAMDHWYIAPRNGHVSLHTTKSLAVLFEKFGWTYRPYGPPNCYLAEKS